MEELIHPLPARYQILELLGEGGMGRVFKAYDHLSQSVVALKTLRTRTAEDLRPLEREIRTLSQLQHENIVRLFEVGARGGEIFFTMELLSGVSLDQFLKGPQPGDGEIKWLLSVGLKVLSALEYLHTRGLVHRDIKPSNILVLPANRALGSPITVEALLNEPDPQTKLLDFGLTRDRESLGTSVLSSGTPLYMSPEQLQGSLKADERSDLYSLGALFYHYVVRRPPFTSIADALQRRSPPPPPHEANPGCNPRTSRAILALIEREPHQRPSSASEVREILLSLLDPGRKERSALPRLLPPSFVGRAQELDQLRSFLKRTGEGGSCLRLVGERGAGKTWLLQQSGLKSEALLDWGMAYVRGIFRRKGAVHQGFKEVFEELLAMISARQGPEGAHAALGAWGGILLETLGIDAGFLGPLGPSKVPAAEKLAASPLPVARERVFQTVLQVVRAASLERPLLLVLEDIQHADEFEMEILGRLSRSLRKLPIGLVVTYRPESVRESTPLLRWLEEREEEKDSLQVLLASFTDREVTELAESMLRPAGKASPELVSFLAERSEGKPVALVRWLEGLWERNGLLREGELWKLGNLGHEGGSLRENEWGFRISCLSAEDKEVLAAALVLGTSFEEELLAKVLGFSALEAKLRSQLSSLARRGFLVEDEEGFSPAPDLDEASLSGIIPDEAIKRFSAAAAQAVLAWYGDAAESHCSRVAFHYYRAGMKDRAIELFLKAARYAARIYANQRGIDAYQRALDLCESEEAKGPIAEELGELYVRVGEYTQALECFRLAKDLGDKGAAASGPESAALLDKIGRVLQRQGEFEGALSMFSRCLEQSRDRPAARAKSLFRIGGIHLDRGDPVAATSSLTESLKLYEELGDFGQLAAVQSGLGLAEKHQDRLDRAVEWFEEALKNAEKSGVLLDVATTLNNLGNAHRARGDDHRAVQCLKRSVETRERTGDRQGLAICLNNIARVYFYRGELTAAKSSTEAALKIFEEVGDKKGVLIAGSNLGEAAHHLGQLEVARRLYTANLELAERLRIQRLLETNLCNLGSLETDAGEYSVALGYLRNCLMSLPVEKPVELRAQALGALGAVSIRLHDLERAEDAVREALDISRELKLREKLGWLASLEVRLQLEKGDPDQALAAGKKFLRQLDHGVEKLGVALFHREMGRVYRELGPDWADQTEKHLTKALKEFESMQSPHHAAATRIELGVYWRLLGEENEANALFRKAEEEFRRIGAPRRLEELRSLGVA